MGFSVDIGVHAHGDRRNLAQRYGDLRQGLHLWFGFDVELPNATLKRDAHFFAGFANARKHDPITGDIGGTGAQVFTDRHNVDASARLANKFQNGDVRQGFHRIADKMRHTAQAFVEQPEMTQQSRRGIDIERCTHLGRDIGQGNVFGVQNAIAVQKVIHVGLRLVSGVIANSPKTPTPNATAKTDREANRS